MTLYELDSKLKAGIIDKLYIFVGNETFLMNTYIDKMCSTLKKRHVDCLSDIHKSLRCLRLINEYYTYVIKDDENYLSDEDLWKGFISGREQGRHSTVFIYRNLDKRSKFYKQHKNFIVDFDEITRESIAKALIDNYNLSEKNSLELVDMCGKSYDKTLFEFNKVYELASADNIDIDKAFKLAKKDNLLCPNNLSDVFKFIDAVCKRHKEKSYIEYELLRQKEDNPIGVLSLLYMNIKNMLVVNSCPPNENIADKTGLTTWQIKVAHEKGRNYTSKELVGIMKLISELEEKLKLNEVDMKLAIPYLLIKTL